MTLPASAPSPVDTDPWRSYPARILRIVPEVPGVRTYELAFNDAAVRDAYRFTAGQFNMLYLPGIGEAAISISSDTSTTATLAHTVRAVEESIIRGKNDHGIIGNSLTLQLFPDHAYCVVNAMYLLMI